MIIKDMVLQKRPDYESNGYHVPTMPHIPRSARGKRSARKKVEDNQMCAFDLLATVAGKLLSERENEVSTPCNTHGTSSPTYANDTMKEIKLKNFFRVEDVDQQRCCDSQLSLEIAFKREIDFGIQENSYASKASASNFDSITIKNDKKDKDIEVGVSTISDTKDTNGPLVNSILDKCNTNSLGVNDHKGLGFGIAMQTERNIVKNRIDEKPQDMSTSKDLIDLETKHPTLVRNENSVEVPMFVNDIPRCRSFPKLGDDMEFFTDKDDENCFRCIHPSILSSEASRPHRIGYRRIKKLLASKYWKLAPSLSHDNEHSNYNVDTRPDFCGKKICYTRQRTQRGPFKRKKLFEQCSMSTRETYCEGLCTLIEKDGIKLEANDSNETLCEANGASSSSITGQKSSPEPQDYHVKVNIKSFRVPELFIEIPETATVGSLKRTVMEAVTAILGRGLRIGVLLHGKKVRDDNKTLSQVGISHNDKLDSLGFTLEPKPTQTSMQTTYEDPHFLNLADHVDPSTRIPPINPSSIDEGNIDATTSQLLLTACPESGHDPVHSLVDASSTLDKSMANSRALVVVPPVNVEALAMVPLCKSRRSEVAQRRIRRPFTVAEVDALVQAVEKLGTGRWRDVKLRAFDNAKHRTYVDLKDKWKTLVHTARISPQQRRGEPVPQELLDRVLSAHAYWSQQQAKLQIKPPPVDTCLLI